MMIERDGVNQMLEKHVETRSDDYWKKIIEDFQKLHGMSLELIPKSLSKSEDEIMELLKQPLSRNLKVMMNNKTDI